MTLLDTGLDTMTGGRVLRAKPYIAPGEPFMLTYGDGLADVNLEELIAYHQSHGKIATVTAVQPAGRFGLLGIEDDERVSSFSEKILGDGGWINGGFFVLKPDVFNYLPENSDQLMWEEYPMEVLSKDNQLVAYKHYGFWKCMDAMRDKEILEQLWKSGQASWKIWE